MSTASKATRASMGVFRLWTTDKGTFPVVIIAGAAALAASASAARYLLQHPDVCFSKAKRENAMHYTEDVGSDWRARRFRLANLKRNPINQSRQFDDLFAKEENQAVRR